MSRRAAIIVSCGVALLGAVLCGCGPEGASVSTVSATNAPAWRLAASTYAFREGTFFEAVDKTRSLGLRYIEAHSWQPMSAEFPNVENSYKAPPAAIEAAKQKLNTAGVKLVSYYFNGLGKNEAETRKVFEYCRTMGVEMIVTEPDPATLDLLDKLTAEYGVNVAIHNHPKDPRHPDYVNWDPEEVARQLRGRSTRIGTCADTGHWVRSGVDPVEGLRKYQGRVLSVHMKDIEKPTVDSRDVPWGTGIGKVKDVMTELQRQRFEGTFTIEYEHNPKDNMKDVAECIAYFDTVAKELGRRRQ